MFTALKTVDPIGVEARTRDIQRHRGEYIVPGPNYIWSLDGYCKLAPFGIEIYAAIDAYSRYIVWFYVGVSARTSISVLKQYLTTVEDLQQMPLILRSDRGGETPLCANAHLELWRAATYDIASSAKIELSDCYYYGTSTANQRIEAWWAQLSKGALYIWRVSFYMIILYNIDFQLELFQITTRTKTIQRRSKS